MLFALRIISGLLILTFGFAWTVGQAGLETTNRNLCDLVGAVSPWQITDCRFAIWIVWLWGVGALAALIFLSAGAIRWLIKRKSRPATVGNGLAIAGFVARRDRFTIREAAHLLAGTEMREGEVVGTAAGYLYDIKKRMLGKEIEALNAARFEIDVVAFHDGPPLAGVPKPELRNDLEISKASLARLAGEFAVAIPGLKSQTPEPRPMASPLLTSEKPPSSPKANQHITIDRDSVFMFLNGYPIVRETDQLIASYLGLELDHDNRISPEMLSKAAQHFEILNLTDLEILLRENQKTVVKFSSARKLRSDSGRPATIPRGHCVHTLFDMLAAKTGSTEEYIKYFNAVGFSGDPASFGESMIRAYRLICPPDGAGG